MQAFQIISLLYFLFQVRSCQLHTRALRSSLPSMTGASGTLHSESRSAHLDSLADPFLVRTFKPELSFIPGQSADLSAAYPRGAVIFAPRTLLELNPSRPELSSTVVFQVPCINKTRFFCPKRSCRQRTPALASLHPEQGWSSLASISQISDIFNLCCNPLHVSLTEGVRAEQIVATGQIRPGFTVAGEIIADVSSRRQDITGRGFAVAILTSFQARLITPSLTSSQTQGCSLFLRVRTCRQHMPVLTCSSPRARRKPWAWWPSRRWHAARR
jgi:hypothetical protein